MRQKLFKALQHGGFIAISIVVTKIIALCAQGKAAQYLGPQNYGISGIFLSILPLVVLLSNMQMDPLLVRNYISEKSAHKQHKLIEHIFNLRLLLLSISAFCALLALYFIEPRYSLCLALIIPFYYSQSLKPAWLLQATHRLHIHYTAMLIQTVTTVACIFIFFRPNQALGSDLICYSIGGSVAFLYSWKKAHHQPPTINISKACTSGSLALIKTAKPLLGIATCTIFFNSLQIPLVASLASTTEAGFYRTATLLSENIYTTLFTINALLLPHMIRWRNSNEINFSANYNKTIRYVTLTAFICVFAGYLLAPILYKFIYSDAYTEAIPEFRLLLIAKIMLFLAGTLTQAFIATNKESELFKILAPITAIGLLISYCATQACGTMGTASAELTYATILLIACNILWRRTRSEIDQSTFIDDASD